MLLSEIIAERRRVRLPEYAHHAVVDVLGSWHLQSRWWGRERHSYRPHYRVETADLGVYELYYDQVPDIRVLAAVQD